jgi:hypothetical protein
VKCFYHHEQDAVGLCKSCNRALCPECAAEAGRGIACKGRCEEHAPKLSDLIDRNIAHQPAADDSIKRVRRNPTVGGLFYILCGSCFLFFTRKHLELRPLLILGGIFILMGRDLLIQARRTPRFTPPGA